MIRFHIHSTSLPILEIAQLGKYHLAVDCGAFSVNSESPEGSQIILRLFSDSSAWFFI
jgi:hypothetical protein